MLLMGKSTISMAIFNSFLYVYQRWIFQPEIRRSMVHNRRECKTARAPLVTVETWRALEGTAYHGLVEGSCLGN